MPIAFDFEVAAAVLNLVSMLMNVKKTFFARFPQTSVWGDLLVPSGCVYRGKVKRHAVVRCNQVVCYYTVGDVPGPDLL